MSTRIENYAGDKAKIEDLPCDDDMAWSFPQYTRETVNAAGVALINFANQSITAEAVEAFEGSLVIINNWRSSHSFPLNTFQTGLRRRSRHVDSRSLVAQRIKRLSSIQTKLERFRTMKLTQMQDIGGCRAVVENVAKVRQLAAEYRQSDIKHKLASCDDYIQNPKKSGYRGIHLVYRYYSDRKETYNDLKIEIQIRSPLQHAWATAVETVGTFTRQALKSSQGESDWLRFFALMGTAIAVRENTPPVPETHGNTGDLRKELLEYSTNLDVENRLRIYGSALQTSEQPSAKGAHYFLLKLDPSLSAPKVEIRGYRQGELQRASAEYLEIEKAISKGSGADAVLVSAESFSALRRAYPNYFLDTKEFLAALKQVIG